MYISFELLAYVIPAICLLKILSDVSIEHASAVREKKRLIEEAEEVISSMDGKSWNEMTEHQKEIYECALSRLAVLKSYKKNHAPDHFTDLKEWPQDFKQKLRCRYIGNIIHK